jgi:hypothetical protein
MASRADHSTSISIRVQSRTATFATIADFIAYIRLDDSDKTQGMLIHVSLSLSLSLDDSLPMNNYSTTNGTSTINDASIMSPVTACQDIR